MRVASGGIAEVQFVHRKLKVQREKLAGQLEHALLFRADLAEAHHVERLDLCGGLDRVAALPLFERLARLVMLGQPVVRPRRHLGLGQRLERAEPRRQLLGPQPVGARPFGRGLGRLRGQQQAAPRDQQAGERPSKSHQQAALHGVREGSPSSPSLSCVTKAA
jgi:hypothetical protein